MDLHPSEQYKSVSLHPSPSIGIFIKTLSPPLLLVDGAGRSQTGHHHGDLFQSTVLLDLSGNSERECVCVRERERERDRDR